MALAMKGHLRALRSNSFIGPAAILFISANIANAANLIFNMIFARLMGPAIFADLTLLLTLKLGVLSFLGALQFAFSEHTARDRNSSTSKIQARSLSATSLKFAIPVMFVIIASSGLISEMLNFSSPVALTLLALAIPFFIPMVIYRGLVQGLIDVPKIVLSIQAEWIIRLFGSVLLWEMGFGLPGIAFAVALSIVAGFVFSTNRSSANGNHFKTLSTTPLTIKTLGVTAMPYLILQMAQILVLDSDIVIAKTAFTSETAGLVAGLLLIQRVFFFAFLSFSTILQPIVAQQKNANGTPKELFMLLLGIGGVTILALAVIIPHSDHVVRLMLGEQYMQLSSIIWISAVTGAVFIVSHLCAIYHIAKGQKIAAKIVLGFGVVQLIILASVNQVFPDIGLHTYFSLKLAVQTLCAICLLGTVLFAHRNSLNKG